MSTQTTPGQSFPLPCRHCGGALYQPSDVCPYCGTARPLADDPNSRFAAASAAGSRTGAGPLPPDIMNQESEVPSLASPDAPIPPLGHLPLGSPVSPRWILTRGLIALVVAVLGYGGYTLLSDRQPPPSGDEQDAKTSAGAIAPYTPSAQGPSTNAPATGGPVRPSLNTPVNVAAAPPRVVVQPSVAPHYHDVPESLHAARNHRQTNDLTGAQAAVTAALSMDPGNGDAQNLQHELTPLEQRRDAALQTAQVCIKDRLWNCVEHSASDALAIDNGSPEAKAMLERAIVETGWTPLGGHAAPATRTAQTAPPASPASQGVATPGNTESALDALARAIAASGWKHPASAGAGAAATATNAASGAASGQ